MAQIIGMAALSHSPFWDLSFGFDGPGAEFAAGAGALRARVAQLAPDAVVVFGPDHFRNFFYDVLPPFCMGLERLYGFGDYGTPRGALPGATALARSLYARVGEAGFDPALSLNMGLDHGLVQSYAALLPSLQVPLVPIMVNANGGPRPSLRRCYDFGRAIGQAIRAATEAERVLIIGSGGLSHWPKSMSADDPAIDAETRDYAINGRARVQENSAARDAGVVARRGKVQGRVNPAWDRWFLARVQAGDIEAILRLSPEEMERDGGNGAHEVRAWIAALGAWGGAVRSVAYEPVPEWVTGMGCIGGW